MQAMPIGDKDTLPALGLGTWKSAPGAVYSAVKEALAAGYRHVDCAPIYQNENEIGRALAESFASGAATRQQVWLTSKLWNSDHAPADVRPALERTLRDLQVDVLQRSERAFGRLEGLPHLLDVEVACSLWRWTD